MPTKAEQTARTRAALVAAGRRLFAERGFADTSTEELVRTAGVTRGALYHHFRDKRDLFEAVYEDVEAGLADEVTRSVPFGHAGPLEVLRRGADAFLDACLDPAVQRIVLLEGPTVLGWERWREIDQRYGLGLVRSILEAAIAAGEVQAGPVEPLAHVLFGGLVEAAMLLAASTNPNAVRAQVGEAVRMVLDGLSAAAPGPGGDRRCP
ncbi:MAG TPA: TetR/AcrR family transcriptional regulator [Acidimicrobiales bacterium]|nr:TetR/AcrR family transcriptional regulator [Acidimicrobiales bacterium]